MKILQAPPLFLAAAELDVYSNVLPTMQAGAAENLDIMLYERIA